MTPTTTQSAQRLLGAVIVCLAIAAPALRAAEDPEAARIAKSLAVVQYSTGPNHSDVHTVTAICVDASGVFMAPLPHRYNEHNPQHDARLILPGGRAVKAVACPASQVYGYRLLTVSSGGNLAPLEIPGDARWEDGLQVRVVAPARDAPGYVAVPFILKSSVIKGWVLQPPAAETIKPDMFGAPVISASGALVGTVTSPEHMSHISSAGAYLQHRQIDFMPPPIPHLRRHDKREFTIHVNSYCHPKDRLSVQLATGSLRGGMQSYPAATAGVNTWKVTAPPVDEAERDVLYAPDYRVTVKLDEKVLAELPGTFEIENVPANLKPKIAGGFPVIKSPPFEGDALDVRMPSYVNTTVLAGGGRYLVGNMADINRIAVLDVNEGRIVKYLSTQSRPIIAAGMRKLIIILPAQRLMERWDIPTFTREQTAPLPQGLVINSARMGCASDGPMLLQTSTTDRNPRHALMLIDIQRLTDRPFGEVEGTPWKVQPHMSIDASADGTIFTGWFPGAVPPQAWVLNMRSRPASSAPLAEGHLMASASGALLAAPSTLYDSKLQPVNRIVSGGFGVVDSGDYVYQAEPDKVTFWLCSTTPAKPLAVLHQPAPGRMAFIPQASLLVWYGNHWRSYNLRRFNIAAEAEKIDADYFFIDSVPPRVVPRGQPYRYQVGAHTKGGGLRYVLQGGPRGMTINDSGLVEWAGSAAPTSPASVTVTCTDVQNRVLKQTWTVMVE